ncbi:MAG: CrcB protein [Pseudonocardiales bacterium]|nr:MAG: CrcB protein [Pseudonocardiales bacterium]
MGLLAVALPAAIGAPLRHLVHRWIHRRYGGTQAWGTFVINVSGSFALGVVIGLALFHGLPQTPKLALGTGFCGAYTTFSTFTFETLQVGRDTSIRAAAANIVGSLTASLLAAAAGLAVAAIGS